MPIDALFGALSSSLAAVGSREDSLSRGIERTLRLSGALFALSAGPALAVTLAFANLAFPPSFTGLPVSAVALGVTSLLVSSANPILGILFAKREARPLVWASGLALLANLLASAVLIPAFLLTGAIAANMIGSAVFVGLLWIPMLKTDLAPALRSYIASATIPLALATAWALPLATVDYSAPVCAATVLLALGTSLLLGRVLPGLVEGDRRALLAVTHRRITTPFATILGAFVRVRPDDAA